MEVLIYHIVAVLISLFILRIALIYFKDSVLLRRFKNRIYDRDLPLINIDSLEHIPWQPDESFRLSIETEEDVIYFEYGSTAEALDMLSNDYISPGDTSSIPVDGSECPVCNEIMNPLSGAEGFMSKTVAGVFKTREPVNICIPCSKELRREMVQRGTPTHTTSEILAKDWSELEADVDFL